MSEPALSPIALRCHAQPAGWQVKRRRASRAPWAQLAVLLATAARSCAGEPLRFGACAVLASPLPDAEPFLVRLFYPEDAPAQEVEQLTALTAAHGLAAPLPRATFLELLFKRVCRQRLPLVGRALPRQLGRLAADWRQTDAGGFSLILWTAPCPPGRRSAEERRRRPKLRNGELENGDRPRILISPLDGARATIRFAGRGRPDRADLLAEGEAKRPNPRYAFPGAFLDLDTLADGLCVNREPEPAAAQPHGEAELAPDAALGAQLERLLAELRQLAADYSRLLAGHRAALPVPAATPSRRRVPAPRQPSEVYSPASYAETLFEAVGLRPPLAKFALPQPLLGKAMGALYGGEAFVGIRQLARLPVSYLDITSEYAVAAHLSGAFELLRATALEVVEEDPEELQAFLAGLTLERLLEDRSLWPRLGRTLCEILPRGDLLPHRVPNGKRFLLKLAPLRHPAPLPFTLADALRSVLESGALPEIRSAFSLRPLPGRRQRLRKLLLPSGRLFDPNRDDLFLALSSERLLLERRPDLPEHERKRQARLLKLIVNAACFGLLCQVNVQTVARRGQTVEVFGPEGARRLCAVETLEEPGRWYCPPIAAGVSGTGRLLHGVARLLVERAGGTVAYGDTDSLCAVSSRAGGALPCPGGPLRDEQGRRSVPALSDAQIEQVRAAFEPLSPYPPELAGEGPLLLGLEPENYTDQGARRQLYLDASASKSYELYTLTAANEGRPASLALAKVSAHGLGHLRAPASAGADWIAEGKRYLLARALGLAAGEPGWFCEPALSVISLNRPAELARLERTFGMKSGLRPFARLAVCQPLPLYARDADGERRTPVAPYHERFDAAQARWRDLRTGTPLRLRFPTGELGEADLREEPGRVLCETVGGTLRRGRRRREAKALDPDGNSCGPATVGPLKPAPSEAYRLCLIGKETRNLERAGITEDPAYTLYSDPDEEAWQQSFLPVLRDLPKLAALAPSAGARLGALAQAAGVSRRTLERAIKSGRASARLRACLAPLLGKLARQALRALDPAATPPADPEQACYLCRKVSGRRAARSCLGCATALTGRQRQWCSEGCRKRAARRHPTTGSHGPAPAIAPASAGSHLRRQPAQGFCPPTRKPGEPRE